MRAFTMELLELSKNSYNLYGLLFYALRIINIYIDFIYCLLFETLIWPKDKIAVLGIMKKFTK
jgi:hypothetical protein